MKTGFTLIELLVVVLIIGILSAVALPQYETAVLKARYTQLQTIVSSYKKAAEVYYMANGEYPAYWSDMDLTPPGGCVAQEAEGGQINCNAKSLQFDLYSYDDRNIIGFYRPGGNIKIGYVQWLDNTPNPARRECWAPKGDARAEGFCRSMGGTLGDQAIKGCSSAGGCTQYILP